MPSIDDFKSGYNAGVSASPGQRETQATGKPIKSDGSKMGDYKAGYDAGARVSAGNVAATLHTINTSDTKPGSPNDTKVSGK